MDKYNEETNTTLMYGDCLERMNEIPEAWVDAVICDPPYLVGAVSVGNSKSKSGTWADMENSAYWFSAWISSAKRTLKDTGHFAIFCNWRTLPTMIRALSLSGLSASSCMVWDKEWIGPAGPSQLRGRYELVILSAMSKARIEDRSAPDIFSCKWMAGHMGKTGHPAEKPVQVMEHLIGLLTPDGGIVLDPFMGSGTTGKACQNRSRGFVGIEREQGFYNIASLRLIGDENG